MMKTKNQNFKVYNKTKNQNVEYTIEKIIDKIHTHDGKQDSEIFDFNADGKSELIGVKVVNAAGNVFLMDVLKKQKPIAYYHNSDHLIYHPQSGIRQHSYSLIYEITKPITRLEALAIENEIIHEIKQENKSIDLHGGELIGFHDENHKITTTKHDPEHSKLVNVDSIKVDVETILNKRDKEQDFKEMQEMMNRRMKISSYKAFEFIKMAEFLNNKKVYLDGHEEITRIDIIEGILNSIYMDEYSKETALQILEISDNKKLEPEEYLEMMPSKGESGKSIGTFIYYAREMGYKRSGSDAKKAGMLDMEDEDKITKINEQVIEIDGYLPTKEMFRIIDNNKIKKTLVEAPTGSGKTYSMSKAIKLYTAMNDNVFAIIASPTIPLAQQTASGDSGSEFGEALRGRVSVKKVINDAIERGDRTVVSTFDRASQVVDEIKSMYKNAGEPVRFVIIVDEGHKEFTDIDYRGPAITSLFNLRDNDYSVEKFISLSGTTLPVVETAYDEIIRFEQTKSEKTFDELTFLTYNKSNELEEITVAAIAEYVKKGNKALVFVQNRKSIERIQEVLNNKWKINTATIKAQRGNENRSETYKHLVEKKAFPEGIDVILSTSVISDGVSIENETGDYVTILATHYNKSRIFDMSLIKQMSHRLRTKYKNLIIPMLIPSGIEQERMENDLLFDLKSHYAWLMFKAEKFAEFTKEKFKDNIDMYKPSVLEVNNGLHGKNELLKDGILSEREFYEYAVQLERHLEANPNRVVNLAEASVLHALNGKREQLWTVDYRMMRYKALKDAEDYYSYNPIAFIRAVEDVLGVEGEVLSAYEELESLSDLKQVQSTRTLQKLNEEEKEMDEARADNLENVLTSSKYEHVRHIFFKYGNKLPGTHDLVIELQDNMSIRHYKVLSRIVAYVIDYESAISIIKSIKRDSDITLLIRRLDAIQTVNKYMSDGKVKATITQMVLDKMVEFFENAEYIEHKGRNCLMNSQVDEVKDELAKEIKGVTKQEINSTYNKFFLSDQTKTVRVEGRVMNLRYDFRLVNIEDAAIEFNISMDSMKSIYSIYTGLVDEISE